jgi:hypothetical protein
MANVVPGFTFTPTTPITSTDLNLLGQPTVSIGAGEVVASNLSANMAIPGFTLAANTKMAFAAPFVETFSGTISMVIDNAHSNARSIACTSNTASTITPTTGGAASEPLFITFTTDGTGGNVITYAAPFKTTGTQTLTGASKKFTICFLSDGTNFNEICRTAALS